MTFLDWMYADQGGVRINVTVAPAEGDPFPFTFDPADDAPTALAVAAFLASETPEIAPYEAPEPIELEPGTTPPRLVASALNINVADNDIPSVEGIFNIAAAIYFDVGQYMLLFLTSQPDANYFVTLAGGAPCMNVTEKNVDYIMVEARASVDGVAVDPAQFGVQVYRT